MNLYRRKLDKIYNKIINITHNGGRTNFLEFERYVDELLEKGQYTLFMDSINIHYHIDLRNKGNVYSYLKKLWEHIYTNTQSSLELKIKKKHNALKIYQNGLYLYDTYTNLKIGKIEETEVPLNILNYYIKNKSYSRALNELVTILIATKLKYKLNGDEVKFNGRLDIDNFSGKTDGIYIVKTKIFNVINEVGNEINLSELIIEEYHNPATTIHNINQLIKDFSKSTDENINKIIENLSDDNVKLLNEYDPSLTTDDNFLHNYERAVEFFLNNSI